MVVWAWIAGAEPRSTITFAVKVPTEIPAGTSCGRMTFELLGCNRDRDYSRGYGQIVGIPSILCSDGVFSGCQFDG